jgi:hypothetical protein
MAAREQSGQVARVRNRNETVRAHVVPIFDKFRQIWANLHKTKTPHFQRVVLMAKNLLI